MKPYSKKRNPKGLAGCRKSKDSAHRRRCLRVDKKAARQKPVWDDDAPPGYNWRKMAQWERENP